VESVKIVASPRFLILETSSRIGQVAVAEDDRLLEVRRLEEARRHARDLAPAIGGLLQKYSWRPGDIHAVIVSHGPGSYTGLRVGIVSAKTFAYAAGCRLLTIETFAAIAGQAPAAVACLDVIADAQQGKIYVQRFGAVEDSSMRLPQRPLTVSRLEDWQSTRSPGAWVTGPGLRVYRDRIPENIPCAAEESWDPQPESLLQIGRLRFHRGESDDLWSLEPLYARPSSAEEKWQARSS
jgi:tRNA threonylcarbamoyladenosine biosynthesis protein TsaB